MKNIPHDLGVFTTAKKVFLFSHALIQGKDTLHLGASNDGINFRPYRKTPEIKINNTDNEDTRFCTDFRISYINGQYVLLYKFLLGKAARLCLAFSKDGIKWVKKKEFENITQVSMIAPEVQYEKQYVMYTGEGEISIAYSPDLLTWNMQRMPLLTPRHKYFDNHPLTLGSIIYTRKGILVLYYVKKQQREGDVYSVGAALFDKKTPHVLLWRSDLPLWEQNDLWNTEHVYPMGGILFQENLYLYFGIKGDAVYAISLGNLKGILEQTEQSPSPKLYKHPHNPIITPVLKHVWEASATFNAAALEEGGKVHFVYRAMGPQNTSVLGYASSSDGVHIDERLPDPIYYPTEPFEVPVTSTPAINYMSGGGYGGCEDPRLTKIDDTIYMTYVAYNGRDAPKVALTSIKLDHFLNKNWLWARPKIISSPYVVNKNCVIFPEKINGKYVIMHRVFPDILIDYVDTLDFENSYLTGQYQIAPRQDSWDSRKLGAGAPPVKTDEGWLLIYQAVDDKDPGRYKIGAMLLDLNDPTKVLYRPHTPILEPSEWYENEGFKGGITYPCGAVVKDGVLYVYYGGADTVICVATAPLTQFLETLKNACINKESIAPDYFKAYSSVNDTLQYSAYNYALPSITFS